MDVGAPIVSVGARGWGAPVSVLQRARILSAAVALAGEVEHGRMSVRHVARRARVSQLMFHEYFDDLEECLLAAFEDALGRIAAVVVGAYEREDDWPEKVRAAVTGLLAFVEHEPAVGTFVFVGALRAGPKVLARRMEAVEQVMSAFEDGIDEAGGVDETEVNECSPLTAEGAVNGVVGILHTRILEGSTSLLGELLNPLTAMIVVGYLGRAAAANELSRPAPDLPRSPEMLWMLGAAGASNGAGAFNGAGAPGGLAVTRSDTDGASNGRSGLANGVVDGAEIRVGFRALRVLEVIAELNGRGSFPSNREIADAAGIKDQGQVSRLLKRLAELGLIENTGGGWGEPSAWRLTVRGEELKAAIGREPVAPARSVALDLMRASGGRLRHRAVSVLRVVGTEPGLSNREVAVRVGIGDENNMSRHLARLARRGLIENTRNGGRYNVWRLTASGEELERAVWEEGLDGGR